MKTQICTKCHEEKPATNKFFPIRSDGRNGGLKRWIYWKIIYYQLLTI